MNRNKTIFSHRLLGSQNWNSPQGEASISATRSSLQLGRRLFHMSMGVSVGIGYALFLSYQQAVFILGLGACLLYLFEQIRINYPEISSSFKVVSTYLLRAEEQLQESAAIPYAIAILLTIMMFPKSVAISAILTLAIADPASAIIGISFGKKKLVGKKSLAGTIAFTLMTFLSIFFIFITFVPGITGIIAGMALIVSVVSASFELLPIRLDDNLTIPLFVATMITIFAFLLDIPTL